MSELFNSPKHAIEFLRRRKLVTKVSSQSVFYPNGWVNVIARGADLDTQAAFDYLRDRDYGIMMDDVGHSYRPK